jgi:hypothetical protein
MAPLDRLTRLRQVHPSAEARAVAGRGRAFSVIWRAPDRLREERRR